MNAMANEGRLEFAGMTDPGLVRAQNEDAIAISSEYGLAVLADGMGGYNAGEVASSMAAAMTKELIEQDLVASGGRIEDYPEHRLHQLVVNVIQQANAAILGAARTEPQYHGMGTTIVAAAFGGDQVTVAHVGDSRAYRFRKGELTKITRDHSLLQEQIDAGLVDAAMARFSQVKNLVTRAVGVGPELEVEIHAHLLQPGDIYLLCSDGLTDMLPDETIGEILAQEQDGLEAACRTLVQRANEAGGFDNISVVLAKVSSAGAGPAGLLERIRNWVS